MTFDSPTIVFLVSMAIFTLTASVYDLRFRRIPNWLSVTALFTGLLFQTYFFGWWTVDPGFFGWCGLSAGLCGFVVGFGVMFFLWGAGQGGGGDVKLMAGLGMWLGLDHTLYTLGLSLVGVLLATGLLKLGKPIDKPADDTGKAKSVKDRHTEAPPAPRAIVYAPILSLSLWLVVVARLVYVAQQTPAA